MADWRRRTRFGQGEALALIMNKPEVVDEILRPTVHEYRPALQLVLDEDTVAPPSARFPATAGGLRPFPLVDDESIEAYCQELRLLAIGDTSRLNEGLARLLADVANYPDPIYYFGDGHRGFSTREMREHLLVQATRALHAILCGNAVARLCPAPAPGSKRDGPKCGQWFTTRGGAGRPRLFCSDTCAKRASRYQVRADEYNFRTEEIECLPRSADRPLT